MQGSPWGVVGHVTPQLLLKCLIGITIGGPFHMGKDGGTWALTIGHGSILCRDAQGHWWVT